MWAAVIIAILTTFAYGWVEGFLGLLLVRCIWGIGWALFRMAGYLTVVTQSEDGNRGEYMGAYNGLPGVQRIGYIGLFRQSDALLFLGILCTGIVMAMVYQGLYTSTISHLVGERMPQDWTFLGFAVGAATIAGALQALRWTWDPWLSPWIGRTIDGSSGRTPMLIGSLIAAAVLFMLVSTTLPFIVWLFLLIGIMITGTTMHTVVDSMMADRAALGSSARIITVYTIAVDIGASIGPTLAYVFMDTFQSSSVYMFSGFILLLVGALWFWRELRMKVSRRT
jgi:MFS family permease